MEVTRDIINDLLPVYLAGEASPDTVRLIEDFFAAHPELADRLQPVDELLKQPVVLQPDAGKQALDRVKRLIKRQTWFMAFALLFTLIPLSVRIEHGRPVFFLLQETPALALAYWLLAALCWLGYYRTRRRLDIQDP